ncbi:hypothetical protein [Deinococcus frigens]|uniref:hypothetical protein n=1 Tax=Deinococcus frigens TaxID=249403 RepID=UPI0004965664|nr:hypothetical protein [Deinococcus frigens]
MKNLKTVTQVFAGGKWLPAGSPLPSDLPNFDYEKHAAKGMIEDTEGEEIINPRPESAPDPVTTLDNHATAALQTALDAAQQWEAKATAAQTQATQLREQVQAAQGKAADPADVTALKEYRDVVGVLLPHGFPSRSTLFENGYYTADMVQGATDQELIDLSGIAQTSLEAIRKVVPPVPQE